MIRLLTLATLAVVLMTSAPVSAECAFKFCQERYQQGRNGPKTHAITNTSRQRLGDVYDNGPGRIQIRDRHRRIVGYIESSSQELVIVNTHRQKVGSIEALD